MTQKYILLLVISLSLIFSGCITSGLFSLDSNNTYKIGFVGPMSGSLAKYGAYEAVKLAQDEINAIGGINGKQLEIIYEDGKGNENDAIIVVNKLISVDNVNIVLGGHCTAESLSIAPVLEKSKVLMLASITSTPKLTNQGDYIFRTSPVSVQQIKLIIDLAKKRNYKNVAIVSEQTDYALPIADKLNNDFKTIGEVKIYEKYAPGTQEFETLVSKITDSNSDFVYLSVQNPDSSFTLIKQLKEHNKNIIIFGNDAVGNTGLITKNQELYSGIVFGTIKFDLNNEKTKLFVSNYKNKFNVDVPYGVWTAESYDAVYVIANALKKCDNNSDCIKSYLYNLKDSEGASGKLSIDSNGDGIREYQLKIVTSSGIQDLN